MPVRIVYSKLPAIAKAIPEKEEKAIDDFANELMDALRAGIWRRHGYISASVKDHSLDPFLADIHIGEIGGIGFYSGFQELGTVKQAPRPVVGPTVHMFEPRLEVIVAEALRKAARAG